jgi:hypothetical protein
VLARIRVRQLGWGILALLRPAPPMKNRLAMYRVTAEWNRNLKPLRFVESGEEPRIPPGVALPPSEVSQFK